MMFSALLVALAAPALADAPDTAYPDRGIEVANPYNYETNPTWTPTPVEGLRKLEVDATAFVSALRPASAAGTGKGNLVLANMSSGWAYVDINGARLGTLGTLARGTLYGVPSGTYKVTYTLSSGYTWTEQIATCPDCVAATWKPNPTAK